MLNCVSDVTLHLPGLSRGHYQVQNNALTGDAARTGKREPARAQRGVFFHSPDVPRRLLSIDVAPGKTAQVGLVLNDVGTSDYHSICICAESVLLTLSLW